MQKIREEIDTLDNVIQDLLIQRAGIIQKVVKVKKTASYRPEREANIVRRLLARHEGDYPFEAIHQIWREIISVTLRTECNFSIATLDKNAALTLLSQKQFGVLTPLSHYPEERDLFDALYDAKHALGMFPYTAAFFQKFVTEGFYKKFQIVGLLPFLDKISDTDGTRALIIAKDTPETQLSDENHAVLCAPEALPSVPQEAVLAEWSDATEKHCVFTLPFAQWTALSGTAERTNIKLLGTYANPLKIKE
ncbi:MAG: chorismate mutase [Alphaproteobacteria bacterium]